MNIKEINEKIESELGIYPKTELGINLLTFYILSKRVKCNGVYEDYYHYSGYEGGVECEERIYYNLITDSICRESTFENSSSHDFDGIYSYDVDNDTLIDEFGNPVFNKDYLQYYKCCKKDAPYFKPIRLEGNLTINCELKLYSGDEFIASLEDIVTMLNNKNEYEFKDIRKLERLVKGLTINMIDLPKPYRKYIARMSKFELGKIEFMAGNYKKALEIFKELTESSKRCTLKKIKEI